MKIALYDDDASHRKIFMDHIHSFNFERNMDLHPFEFSSIEALLQAPPDYQVLLLDIKLERNINGIDIAQTLRKNGFEGILIFITCAAEYALEGYKADTFRYLMKPLQKEPFYEAVTAAIRKLETGKKQLSFISNGEKHFCPVCDILYIESYYRIRKIYTLQSCFETREPLYALQQRLPARQFASPHKSFLINLEHVTRAKATKVILSGQREIPIARNRQKEFTMALSSCVAARGG